MMLPEPDDDRPLSSEANAEYLAIMRHARVWDLKHDAEQVATAYRCLEPTPTLDELPQLDAEPHARERQLLLLWLVERRFRRRLQGNLHRALELLAG